MVGGSAGAYARRVLYDAFICHASEDKADFVRPLADQLRAQHIEVWYDEFSLKVGDSLRRSIDRGLSQSRFGIVVLSPDFFGKEWSQWELDGLVARQNSDPSNVILPVWRGVGRAEVLAYSAPLADKLAVLADAGIPEVVRRLAEVIRPGGSTLIIARDHLLEWGCTPPVVTDDWWLDVAAAAESNDLEGTFQEPMGWGRWGFPLPEASSIPTERGWRMAWAAVQMDWLREAERRPVTQITRPEAVLEFIESQPGLRQMCTEYPRYLVTYAPQLTIPGRAGPFEGAIEAAYIRSQEWYAERDAEGSSFGTGLTVDRRTPRCDDEYALRDPEFGGYDAAHVACGFAQGNAVANGPEVRFYSHIDYLAWLLSDESLWLPPKIREYLTKGMIEWGVWIWDTYGSLEERDLGFTQEAFSGAFGNALTKARAPGTFKVTAKVRADLVHRLDFSTRRLHLPETGEALASQVLDDDLLEGYFAARDANRTRKRGSKE